MVGGCLQTLESCYKAEVFDPISLQWTELPDSKHARASPMLVPYRGKFIIKNKQINKLKYPISLVSFSISGRLNKPMVDATEFYYKSLSFI